MSKFLQTIPNLYEAYKKWVSTNPQSVGDLEVTIKWASYFIAGRINSSTVVSELVYSLSNLLVILNDRIIEKGHSPSYNTLTERSENRLKLLLTTLECCEVFVELSAQKLFGEPGRWFFIFVIQVIKCIGRLALVLRYKNTIVKSPPIQFNRANLTNANQNECEIVAPNISTSENSAYPNDAFMNSYKSVTFKLKRSGRVVRKVDGAPPIYARNFKETLDMGENQRQRASNGKTITSAEMLYITKPLIHLGGSRLFGYKSWKSWCLALGIDLISLRIYHQSRDQLSKEQKLELSKRCVGLILYLLRSPFYDRYSANKITAFLNAMGNVIPFAKALTGPLNAYIPQYQDTYFYMYST